jgi:predicted transcriptional regulator
VVTFKDLKRAIIPDVGLRDIHERYTFDKCGWPLKWVNDVKRIAKLYGINHVNISEKFKSNYYDPPRKTICIKIDRLMEDAELFQIFSHELAHRIQDIVDRDRLSVMDAEDYEREAERLAYFIYKEYFARILPIHHAAFSYGRSDRDKEYIRKYYKKEK